MINKEANPFVVNCHDRNGFEEYNLASSDLSNLPTKKSIYFSTRPLVGEFQHKADFLNPWFYQTGVFGTFGSVIGQGASGKVLKGDWFGKRAAFKFVGIGPQTMPETVIDGLTILYEKLSEMTSIRATRGSRIVPFYGHYR